MALMAGGKAAQDTGDYVRELPQEGRYNAVCCDIHLMEGVERKAFAGGTEIRDEVIIVWALGTPEGHFLHNVFEKDGERQQGYVVTVRQPYRFTDAPRSNLMKLLDQWLEMTKKHGANWIKERNIELEKLLGHPAEVKVEHTKDGKYLNLVWAEPLPAHYTRLPLPPASDTGYTRIKDREQKPQGQNRPAGAPTGGVAPSDDPFAPGARAPQPHHQPAPAQEYGYPAGPAKMADDPF